MRAALNILVFLFAAVVVAAAIGRVAPFPHMLIVTSKVAHFQNEGDEFDVLFLGSSRTYRQVIPELLEQEMAAAGKKVKAYNLGIDGMRPPEDTYILEQALKKRTKPLRLVVVECSPIRLAQRPEDRGTLRATYWHDLKRTLVLFRRAFLADTKKRNWGDRFGVVAKAWPDFQEHAEYFLNSAFSLGRGNTLLENWLFKGKQPELLARDIGPRRDGYRASEHAEYMKGAQLADYEKQIAEMRAKPPRVDYGDRVSQDELREKQRIIEKAGGKMILLMPPYTATRFFYPKFESGQTPPVLDFSSLEKYPALYLPEHHSDSGHLNRPGSEIYTRAIARSLLEHLD